MLKPEDADPDQVWFITSAAGADEHGVTLHRRGVGPVEAVARRFDEVQRDWQGMLARVLDLARSADQANPGTTMRLTELAVELGFTASGKLAFIAEAGVSGSITLTFTRAPTPTDTPPT